MIQMQTVLNAADNSGARTLMLGITFKENCPDIRNSRVVDIYKELIDFGMEVDVYDPWANAEEVMHEYGIVLGQVSPEHKVDSLVVAVGHPEFRLLTAEQLRAHCSSDKQPVIGDLKSLYSRHELTDAGFTVFRL